MTVIGNPRYTVLKRLGQGGVGEVFLAQDTMLSRHVALKFMRQGVDGNELAFKWLLQEARAAAAIDHPYVCKVYEVAEDEGRPFIAMEYIEGETLHARLRRTRFSSSAALKIVLEIAEALAAAEAYNVVHRDLKPANIMLTSDDHVKVMDFGLAKRLNQETRAESAPLTWAGTVGTLNYMSPEQIRGEGADIRSDIFSLGIVAYETLAGVHPFERLSPIETAGAILNDDPPSLSVTDVPVPAGVEDTVAKMLAKNPAERHQTARDLAAALVRAIDQRSGPSFPAPRQRRDVNAPSSGFGSKRGRGFPSLVVMPTRVVGGEADQFLADAIPNALSKFLVRVPELETKRPPTAGDIERVAGDLDRIAALCGATSYVASMVVVQGERLGLSVQVVDTLSRTLRSSDDFEGVRSAYGELIREAAQAIQHAVKPQQETVAANDGFDPASEAELVFQRGLFHLNLFRNLGRPGDFERAAAALQQAIEQQPDRADGPIGMALLHNARIVTGASAAEVVSECERWVRRAMSVNPRASKAWAILGEIETIRRPEQVRKPLEYGLKAAAFGPRDGFAHTRLAGCFMMHSYELSLITSMEGARLDPLVLDAPIYAAISMNALNRGAEALAMIRHVLEIEPDMVFGRLIEALILADCGSTADARSILATLQPMVDMGRLLPQWPRLFSDVAAYRDAVRDGDTEALDRLHVRLSAFARGEDPFPRWQVTTQGIMRLVAKIAPDLALNLFAARALMGIVEPYDYLVTHPELDPLRGDVRFQQMLATSRRNFDELTAIIHDCQQRGEVPEYVANALNDLVRRFELPAAAC